MHTLWQDARYGLRMLLKQRGFTVVAVITLAIGIGANATIFSFINGLLLRPLSGVERPDQLVGVYTSDYSSGPYGESSYPDYLDFCQQANAFSGLAASESASLNLAGKEAAERVRAVFVTGNYFGVLGVRAVAGRTLLEADDERSAIPSAVISYGLWRRQFASDPGAVGRTIRLNDRSYTIVGVTAESFRGLRLGVPPDVWLPLLQESAEPASRGDRGLQITARLRNDVTIDQAQAQLTAIADRLAHAYPESNMGTLEHPNSPRPMSVVQEARIRPAQQKAVRRLAALLLVVVGLVLLIACANVANLLLTRAAVRRREVAIRVALGAGRWRLTRQLVTENISLSLIGGGAGLCVSFWTAGLIPTFFPPGEADGLDLSVDWRVLGFTLAITILTGLLFGFAPVLRASRSNLVSALKDDRSNPSLGQKRFGLRGVLVSAQIAVSLLLLIGAGLFLRSLRNAVTFDPGFAAHNLLLASLATGGAERSKAQTQAFYQQVLERVRAQPGVRSASLTSIVPLSGGGQRRGVRIEGYEPRPNEDIEINTNVVGLTYFETLGIPIVQGRDFNETDKAGGSGVVIVNEEFAHRYFPGQSALSKRVRTDSAGPYLEIVGVVRTAKYRDLREAALPFVYIPLTQEMQGNMTLVVRTTVEPERLRVGIRNDLQAIDRSIPVFRVKTMTEEIEAALSADRMVTMLLAIFGGSALLLAAVGIYGVVSYAVAQRTHEIGIRMALGAQRTDVLRLVVRSGMMMAMAGVVVGLAAAYLLTRLLASLLFGITPTDLPTFVLVTLGLLLIALLACYVPARRATKVDPLAALRYE